MQSFVTALAFDRDDLSTRFRWLQHRKPRDNQKPRGYEITLDCFPQFFSNDGIMARDDAYRCHGKSALMMNFSMSIIKSNYFFFFFFLCERIV